MAPKMPQEIQTFGSGPSRKKRDIEEMPQEILTFGSGPSRKERDIEENLLLTSG